MYARASKHLLLRKESFGATAYVADRDDIFLMDDEVSRAVRGYTQRWKRVPPNGTSRLMRLAALGILEIREGPHSPTRPQEGYSGVHLLGRFADIPLVARPLLVNCFSTAWCPLKCAYCHADDLMEPERRERERLEDVDQVAQTARKLSALVHVVTGGDPLTSPSRAARLVEQLPAESAIVYDTSGVGRLDDARDLLKLRPSHLRVSIDSMDPRVNRKTRPVNPRLRARLEDPTLSSLEHAARLIDEVGALATGVTVQTVISSKNDSLEHLLQLRDWLASRGVRNWVLHIAINAGAARKFAVRTHGELGRIPAAALGLPHRKAASILPERQEASRAIRQLIDETQRKGMQFDIRTTDASSAPNSVFLVESNGELFTQGRGPDGGRKVRLFGSSEMPSDPRALWTYVSSVDHVQRYINFVPTVHGERPNALRL